MLQVTLELESNPFIFAGQQEVSCAPSEASSDIGIAKAAQPASRAPTDPSSPVTAEPASRASRFETGQQEVSCAPSEASSDIAKVAQPASRAPTVTAAPTHPGTLPKAGQPTLKRLCPTRWASRQDAVQSLRFRYADIMQALTKIDLLSKKSEERAEATGLKKAMESFEFVLMTVIQGKVLETVNIVSQALQRKDVDLLQATAMLGNATDTLAQLRGEFDGLKAQAQDLASSWGVHSLFKDRRARRTKRHFSELCEDQRLQDPGEHFRVAVFYANIDIVVAQLKNRFVGMSEVAQRFSFLLPRKLLRATDKDLSESASALSGQYKDDLSAEFPFQILSLRNALRPTIKKIERGTIKDLAQTLLIENQSILPSIP
ncbi:52 kDa repressor of the inhibitor of the protein kinase, partial [Dissostichus eleginoides]